MDTEFTETIQRLIRFEQRIDFIERRMHQLGALIQTLRGHIWDVEDAMKELDTRMEFQMPVSPPADDKDTDNSW